MNETLRPSGSAIWLNKVRTFFSKPYNVILLLLGILLTITTVAPIIAKCIRHIYEETSISDCIYGAR